MTATMPPAFSPRASVESYRVAVVWPAEIAGGGIVASDWLSEPAGLTLSNPAVGATEASVRVSGGEPRTRYVLRNLVQVAGEDGLDTYAVSVPIDCVW